MAPVFCSLRRTRYAPPPNTAAVAHNPMLTLFSLAHSSHDDIEDNMLLLMPDRCVETILQYGSAATVAVVSCASKELNNATAEAKLWSRLLSEHDGKQVSGDNRHPKIILRAMFLKQWETLTTSVLTGFDLLGSQPQSCPCHLYHFHRLTAHNSLGVPYSPYTFLYLSEKGIFHRGASMFQRWPIDDETLPTFLETRTIPNLLWICNKGCADIVSLVAAKLVTIAVEAPRYAKHIAEVASAVSTGFQPQSGHLWDASRADFDAALLVACKRWLEAFTAYVGLDTDAWQAGTQCRYRQLCCP